MIAADLLSLDDDQRDALAGVAKHYLAETRWVTQRVAGDFDPTIKARMLREREVCALLTGEKA